MTERSEIAHRKAEAQAKLLNGVANKAFSKKDTGLDKLAKTLIRRQAPEVLDDPELEHEAAAD